jgi:hypothetical protein
MRQNKILKYFSFSKNPKIFLSPQNFTQTQSTSTIALKNLIKHSTANKSDEEDQKRK